MEGFLSVNKPRGPTSFDVVREVRRALGIKKAGHAGTLDPDASGVLLVALGSSTRLIEYVPAEPKVYYFGVRFGLSTDTLDSEGVVVATGGTIPAQGDLTNVVKSFLGESQQVPPEYSAVKVDGRRAYRLARSGEKPELKARPITIHTIELVSYDPVVGEAAIRVACGGGTYVRALARDMASRLNTVAYASSIHREAIGPFTADRALPFESLRDAAKYIMPVREALRDSPFIEVTADIAEALAAGKDVPASRLPSHPEVPEGEHLFALDHRGHLIAVLHSVTGRNYHPEKVFAG